MEANQRLSFLRGPAGERALLARLAAGDELAYRELYEQYAPGLMRLLMGVVKNRSLAEEILQETFVAAFKHVASFRGEARLATWLAGIALRRAFNSVRDDGRRLRALPAPDSECSAPSPEHWLGDRDLTRKILALLEEMEPAKKLALLLQAEGYTAAEIAEVTGEPRGTVLSRLSRGRAELAERVQQAGLAVAGPLFTEEAK